MKREKDKIDVDREHEKARSIVREKLSYLRQSYVFALNREPKIAITTNPVLSHEWEHQTEYLLSHSIPKFDSGYAAPCTFTKLNSFEQNISRAVFRACIESNFWTSKPLNRSS